MVQNRLGILAVIAMVSISYGQRKADSESMSWLDNGQIRLGADLSIGGSITYLADSKTGDNMINSYDWGRQVQMSFYADPIPYQPVGTVLNENWKFLGWNPIQSGDGYGFRSKVLEHRNTSTELYVKCIPMHWPLKNVPGECTFECWYELHDRAVRVRCRLNNNRICDKTQYEARDQELPAVYTNGPYHKLMTYTGDKPFTGEAWTEIPKKPHGPKEFPWSTWTATENWAALVNEKNFGLGVWHSGVYPFTGGFAGGKPGAGSAKDSPTGYISPTQREILDWNIVYDYQYVLIVDTLENIRQYVYQHHRAAEKPCFTFKDSRLHWFYQNAKDTGWPIKGHLDIRAKNDKPMQILSPSMCWEADKNRTLSITAAVSANDKLQVQGRIYWRPLKGVFSEENSKAVTFPADGVFHTTKISLEHDRYQGILTQLRLDPIRSGVKGDIIKLREVKLE